MKKVAIFAVAFLCIASSVFAANTTTMSGLFIKITGLDADWTLANSGVTALASKSSIFVRSIQFNPSAANDIMIIHNDGLDTTDVFHVKVDGDTDSRIRYYGERGTLMSPVIDISDCTLGVAANASVLIELGVDN